MNQKFLSHGYEQKIPICDMNLAENHQIFCENLKFKEEGERGTPQNWSWSERSMIKLESKDHSWSQGGGGGVWTLPPKILSHDLWTVPNVKHCGVCTVLCCTVQFRPMWCLYCTVLYCTVLYYTVLYCTVQAIVVSDRNNDRKFMFLSEETKPDYRPVEQVMYCR